MSEVHLIPFKLEEVVQTAGEEIPYGIQMINAPLCMGAGIQGKDVVVAVLDTGRDVNHPDLKDRIIGGRNFTSDDPEDYLDGHYHGTHVAGTIAATLNNKLGVAGIAPEAKLLILRVLERTEAVATRELLMPSTMPWNGGATMAKEFGSFPCHLADRTISPKCMKPLKTPLKTMLWSFAQRGNEGDDNERTDEQAYPGYYKEVVQVGAVDEQKHLAEFSNTNDEIDLVAPGVNILSTYPGEKYAKLSGTSMATPHVSGAVAVLILKEEAEFGRELTDPEIYAQLCKNTQTIGLTKKEKATGCFT